jgi:hypothetical protein
VQVNHGSAHKGQRRSAAARCPVRLAAEPDRSAGHSPLSCNGLAGGYPVNPFCLPDDVGAACRAGRDFGAGQPEPGPYLMVEVLRRTDPIAF